MKAAELKQRLIEEGCSPYNFSIGPGGSDVYRLEQQGEVWRVFYTERGKDDPPIFETTSEVEACEFYFDYITKNIRHDHLVGFFISEGNAIDLDAKLAENGIQSHRDKIPYGGWSGPRCRIFVLGKEIFKARAVLGELPLKDG